LDKITLTVESSQYMKVTAKLAVDPFPAYATLLVVAVNVIIHLPR